MSDCGSPANVGSMEGLGGWVPVAERLPAAASNDWLGPMVEGEAYHEWLTAPPPDAMRCVDTRAAFAAGWSAAVAAERERCAKVCEDYFDHDMARIIRQGANV